VGFSLLKLGADSLLKIYSENPQKRLQAFEKGFETPLLMYLLKF
jgi:hypothetical protein